MTWVAATTTGFGVGLASFGLLRWTVHQVLSDQARSRGPNDASATKRTLLTVASGLIRLALLGLVMFGLAREGIGNLLAGVVGILLARECLIRRYSEMARLGGVCGR